jgi:hypothetical protein
MDTDPMRLNDFSKPLSANDVPAEINIEFSAEIPDKQKIIEWLKQTYSEKTGLSVDEKIEFRKWL